MDNTTLANLLTNIPLFSRLPETERHLLAGILKQVQLPEQTFLIKEGDIGDRFYVILSGKVEVLQALGTPEERVLNHLGPNEFFGEMSLLEKQGLRTASIRTITSVEALEMTRSDFDLLLERWPTLAMDMLRELSLRLQETERATIRDLQEKNKQLFQAYEELKAAQAQIIEKEKLERELQVARQIQMSLLPTNLPEFEGYEFWAKMLPARAVGGDLYDVVPLDDEKMGIMIGDVSDKGVPAALFMALTRSLIRAEASDGSDPEKVLLKVNHHLLDMNSANMFVSVLYGILDRRTGQFAYARAGHEVPLCIDSSGTPNRLQFGRGQLLGIFSEPLLDNQKVQIPPGGTMLLFTDGAVDATDSSGNFFGHEMLEAKFHQFSQASAKDICENVFQSILDHQGNSAQQDDITLLAVKARD